MGRLGRKWGFPQSLPKVSSDPQVWQVIALLDNAVDEIAKLVPGAPAMVPVMDTARISTRSTRAHGLTQKDLRDHYNAIAGKGLFVPLP